MLKINFSNILNKKVSLYKIKIRHLNKILILYLQKKNDDDYYFFFL